MTSSRRAVKLAEKAIALTIRGAVPSKANRYRRGKNGGLYSPADVKVFADRVLFEMMRLKIRPLDGDVEVSVKLYPRTARPDLTGCEKALLDAMQDWRYVNVDGRRTKLAYFHGCYHDDKQVKRLVLEHCGVDKSNPRVEVVVTPLER